MKLEKDAFSWVSLTATMREGEARTTISECNSICVAKISHSKSDKLKKQAVTELESSPMSHIHHSQSLTIARAMIVQASPLTMTPV